MESEESFFIFCSHLSVKYYCNAFSSTALLQDLTLYYDSLTSILNGNIIPEMSYSPSSPALSLYWIYVIYWIMFPILLSMDDYELRSIVIEYKIYREHTDSVVSGLAFAGIYNSIVIETPTLWLEVLLTFSAILFFSATVFFGYNVFSTMLSEDEVRYIY